jgi:outer membrane protein OmpA-like peptidoglycan-associated protein
VVPPPPPEPERWAPEDDEPPRRRRRWPALVLVLLVALVGGGGWWVSQGQDSNVTVNPPSTSPSNAPVTQPSASTSPSQPTASESPKLTHAQPSDSPSRKPNVTLKSDLAFTINSAALSSEAKSRLDEIAQQVRDAGLHGQIYVDGYTDNLGSASSGVKLSKARATAVSEYLGSRLVGVPVTIVIVAHGEKDPIASNATESGREKNRRVTITLPKP